jgi:hypothetical protein
MLITNKTLIKDIQQEFNAHYPSLWIEFYTGSGGRTGTAASRSRVNADLALKRVSDPCSPQATDIDIHKDRTVGEIKHDFLQKFGLQARLMRKTGNVWVGTSLTDDWTLERQNSEGTCLLFGPAGGSA